MKLIFEDTESGTIARSYRSPESYGHTYDDRQQAIEIINGVAVEDYGYTPQGDKKSYSALFAIDEYNKLKDFWINRTMVKFTDETGQVYNNVRIVIKSYKAYNAIHYVDFVLADFEIWMV